MKDKVNLERKPLDYYLKLNYPITVYPDMEEGGYVAEIKDLPGCLTQGDTLEETVNNIAEARQLWIETVYDSGRDIPLPSTETDYSGKLLLQMPKSLHRRLAETSSREGVSLNQYILFLLSNGNDNNLAPEKN
ncbi:MAG: type II toxin-antitoxin system HicB family antitoxin [Hormoscilla sp.]